MTKNITILAHFWYDSLGKPVTHFLDMPVCNWYYWGSSLGQVIIMLLTATLVLLHISCIVPKEHSNLTNFLFPIGTQFALSMVVVQLPFVFIGIILLIHYRNCFNIFFL